MAALERLDNPAWFSLMGAHAHLGSVSAGVGRYRKDVAVFAVLENPGQGTRPLLDVVEVGETVALITSQTLAIEPNFEIERQTPLMQMIAPLPAPAQIRPSNVRELGTRDVPAMLALVELTKPGPFLPATREMGLYLGVFDDDRLVAMAGERMHPPGFTEVSAVCTHPDYRGRGYAGLLMGLVAAEIVDRGEVPFLHVLPTNTTAIHTYERIGYRQRWMMSLAVLKRTG